MKISRKLLTLTMAVVVAALNLGAGINYTAVSAAVYCLQDLNDTTIVPFDLKNPTVTSKLITAQSWGIPVLLWFAGIVCQVSGDINLVYTIPSLAVGIAILLTPMMLTQGITQTMVMRITTGILMGWNLPIAPALAHQFYPTHVGLLASVFFSGFYGGLLISYPVQGLLCTADMWKMACYAGGTLQSIMVVAWFLLSLLYRQTQPKAALERASLCEKLKKMYLIVCEISKHRNVYMVTLTQLFSFVFVTVFFVYMPKFFKDLYGEPLRKNSWKSILPTVAAIVVRLIAGDMADRAVKRFGPTRTLKPLMAAATLPPIALIIVLAYVPHLSALVSMCLLILNFAIFCLYTPCVFMPLGILYPNHCGFVSCIISTISALGYLITPYAVEFITHDGTKTQWNTAFIVVGIVPLVLALTTYVFIDFTHVVKNIKGTMGPKRMVSMAMLHSVATAKPNRKVSMALASPHVINGVVAKHQ